MPSRSSAISSDSASIRSKLMFVVFGTRGSRAPLTAVPGTAAGSPRSRRSRSAATRGRFGVELRSRQRARRRRGRRWPGRSPCRRAGCARACRRSGSAAIRVPRLIHSAPAPFGPLNLCADSDSRSTPSARDVDRDLADRLHGVGVEERAALVRDRARARRSAGSCRSRCWRASPRRCAVSSVSASLQARPATRCPISSTGSSVVRPAAARERLQRDQDRLVLDGAWRSGAGGRSARAPRRRRGARSCRPRCRRW